MHYWTCRLSSYFTLHNVLVYKTDMYIAPKLQNTKEKELVIIASYVKKAFCWAIRDKNYITCEKRPCIHIMNWIHILSLYPSLSVELCRKPTSSVLFVFLFCCICALTLYSVCSQRVFSQSRDYFHFYPFAIFFAYLAWPELLTWLDHAKQLIDDRQAVLLWGIGQLCLSISLCINGLSLKPTLYIFLSTYSRQLRWVFCKRITFLAWFL